MENPKNYFLSKTVQYFINVSQMLRRIGLPDVWMRTDIPISKSTMRIHVMCRCLIVLLITFFIVFEIGSFFTQPNLNDALTANRQVFTISHSLAFTFILNMNYFEKELQHLLYALVNLRTVYNDEEIETTMVRKMKMYSAAFVGLFLLAIISYGVDALMNVIQNGEAFNCVVVAWPDVQDKSVWANVTRLGFYLIFWLFMLIVCGVYVVVISVTICLSHQYKNLQSYFQSLPRIFLEEISQQQKENKYEDAFKLGITLHSKTSWCRRQWQLISGVVFSTQVLLNVFVLVLMMLQIVNSERSLLVLLTSVWTAMAVLWSTGLFMLNAGNVTLEAFEVPTAMYQSGWENCWLSTVRIRKLVVCAMMRGQEPEMLTALGIVPLSYESYVSIVKSSYSVFSVIY